MSGENRWQMPAGTEIQSGNEVMWRWLPIDFCFFSSLKCFLAFLHTNQFRQSIQFSSSSSQSDINECQLDPDSCDDGYKCMNTVGSFECLQLNKKPKYEKKIVECFHMQMPTSVNKRKWKPSKQFLLQNIKAFVGKMMSFHVSWGLFVSDAMRKGFLVSCWLTFDQLNPQKWHHSQECFSLQNHLKVRHF